ncbi:MAG: glycosyltransferase [Lachnospiraceae bacterium]|nr:glycosyltransferase [Lachnospiraceae bacterium]
MSVIKKIGTAFKIVNEEGISVLAYKTKYKIKYALNSADPYKCWIAQNETDLLAVRELEYNPKISVVIPVYNIKENLLRECIDSVLNQTYKNFEICLADDASTLPEVKEVLKSYEDDERIKIVYRKENGHISKATNSAIELATGEFIAFMDCDDTLSPNALYEVAFKLNENKDLDYIYSDEDKLSEDSSKRMYPFFKPDWSPDTMMEVMYTCHLSVYRKSIGDKLGWLDSEFDGAQDYDFALRFTEQTKNIGHISKVLYHWRMIEGSTAENPEAKEYVNEATVKLKKNALKRRGYKGEIEFLESRYLHLVHYEPDESKKVSIIIPSKDNFEVYKRCIDSIIEKTLFKNYEIITVDNGSNDEHRKQYEEYCKNAPIDIKYFHDKKDFNFSWMCNKGAKEASGDFYLFLNDDMEVITPEWLGRMQGQANLPYAGAVGAKLIYPNSNLIQHIGVVSLPVGPVHIFCQAEDDINVPMNRNFMDYNYSAVTAACLMVDKNKFEEVGGFDETFAVAYNDVKLCFDLWKKGYYNVCKATVKLYHHESLSRGSDTANPEKFERLIKERTRLYSYHPDLRDQDPFYNVNLVGDNDNFMLNLEKSQEDKFVVKKVTGDVEMGNPDEVKFNIENLYKTDDNSKKTYIRVNGWYIEKESNMNNYTHPVCMLKSDKNCYTVNTLKIYRGYMDKITGMEKAFNLSNFYCLFDVEQLEAGEYRLYIGRKNKWYDTKGRIRV